MITVFPFYDSSLKEQEDMSCQWNIQPIKHLEWHASLPLRVSMRSPPAWMVCSYIPILFHFHYIM